jgi:hypothetical protein
VPQLATGGVSTGGAAPSGGWTSTCATPGYAFCDDFEANTVGGPAAGWTSTTGTWSVTSDPTQVAGDQNVYSNASTSDSKSQAGSGTYANASIEAKIKVTRFSSTSGSNAAGVYLRGNGTNDYDLSLAGDGMLYLRRTPTSSTELGCTSGNSNGPSGVTVGTTTGTDWFKLKLEVTGAAAGGIDITGYVDATGSGYVQVLQCLLVSGAYMFDSGTAGVFSKANAPAEFDDVLIMTL